MANIEIYDTYKQEFLYGDTRYSKTIWWNILSRVIKNLWIDVLFQFGFNKARIERMLDKGLLWWEVDLVSSIRAARANFEVRFTTIWEYKLLQNIFIFFSEYFYLKPVFMLTLHRWMKWMHVSALKKKSYSDIIFNTEYRPIIDRSLLNDWLMYLIAELYKMYQVDKDILAELVKTDISSSDTTARRIFFERFSYMKIDTHEWQFATILEKKSWGVQQIERIFNEIITTYRQHGINNIQQYVIQKTGFRKKVHWNHTFVNFAWTNALPNIYIQDLRTKFIQMKNNKK